MRLRPLLPLLPPVPALKRVARPRARALGPGRAGRARGGRDRGRGGGPDARQRRGSLPARRRRACWSRAPAFRAKRRSSSAARERGIPVWSEIELASRLLPNPIVGVTGTNGKTTTTELLGAMLGARTAGNVGTALSELVGDVPADDWIVCELSSFQLEDVDRFRPRIAVLLNLEPDHLDRHGDFEAYRAAKLRIFENQDRRRRRRRAPRLRDGARRRAPHRVRRRRPAAGRTVDPRRAQPRERRGCDGGRPGGRYRRRADRGGAAHVPRRRAPARARGRDRRDPLRQRLEGDEHGRRAPGADGV